MARRLSLNFTQRWIGEMICEGAAIAQPQSLHMILCIWTLFFETVHVRILDVEKHVLHVLGFFIAKLKRKRFSLKC